jgi:membrane-bound inhibitor of C-type lysozyme
MYKFTILQDDIYVEDESGEVATFNDLSEEQKANQYNEEGLPARESTAIVYSYECSDTFSGSVVYGVVPDAILLSYQGKTETLFQEVSASGTKYSNPDNTFIFREKDGEAFMEIDGNLAHSGCVLQEYVN